MNPSRESLTSRSMGLQGVVKDPSGSFRKFGVPYFGVLMIGILLLRVLH